MQLPALKDVRTHDRWPTSASPRRSLEHIGFTAAVRHARHRARARRARASRCPPLETLRRASCGTTGSATSTPTCSSDRSFEGAVNGKTVRDHRRLVAASAGRRRCKIAAAGGIPLLVARTRGEARGGQGGDRGRRRHRVRLLGDLSDLDVDRRAGRAACSPTTRASTCSSTTPAARSGARSRSRYDRFHDFERTMQLNYFGAIKLIIGLLPHMRERRRGHIVNVSSIGVQTNPPRFSRLRRLEGGARRVHARASRSEVDRRRRHVHDHPHAARAHADDRADEDLRLVPDDHARRGRPTSSARRSAPSPSRSTRASARSARSPTRWRRRPSTRSCTWPTRCSRTRPRRKGEKDPDEKALDASRSRWPT